MAAQRRLRALSSQIAGSPAAGYDELPDWHDPKRYPVAADPRQTSHRSDASAEAGPDAPMRGDVTLSLRRDTLPGDTRSWLNANRTQHDALVLARPLPLPFAARVAAAEPGGLGLEAGWGRPEEEFV